MIAEEQVAPLSVSNPHTEQNIIIIILTNTHAYLRVSESELELFLEVCEQQIFSLCQFSQQRRSRWRIDCVLTVVILDLIGILDKLQFYL